MAKMSEAQKRATKKWNDANLKERYDHIHLVLPKGYKEDIQAFSKAQSKSVNEFIKIAVDERIEALRGSQEYTKD